MSEENVADTNFLLRKLPSSHCCSRVFIPVAADDKSSLSVVVIPGNDKFVGCTMREGAHNGNYGIRGVSARNRDKGRIKDFANVGRISPKLPKILFFSPVI